MRLQIFLPYEKFVDIDDIQEVVIDTIDGSFGLLPKRLDCVAALEPGIISYKTHQDELVYVAIDTGVLVKVDQSVTISVRHAKSGVELEQLYEAVKSEFFIRNESEHDIRASLAKLESGFIRRMTSLDSGI